MLIKSFINLHGSLRSLRSLSQRSAANFKGGIFILDLRRVYESTRQLSGMCFSSRQSNAEAWDVFENRGGLDKETMSTLGPCSLLESS